MKSICLVPYCPWPPDTGTRVEMMKSLNILRGLGPCTLASARRRPVGFGWTPEAEQALSKMGFDLVFREDSECVNAVQVLGFAYAIVCKGLRMERAFGHTNPYHRFAFSERWWRRITSGYDLACMQYGYWARFRSECPQVIILHELLSSFHWSGQRREIAELRQADLIVTVGKDEEEWLRSRGVGNAFWSPPAAEEQDFPVTAEIGMIGTMAHQNLEGLKWLESARPLPGLTVKVFGSMAKVVTVPFLAPVGRYEGRYDPYRACGIHLLTRGDRPGLQIKAVEALACGRAIVARRGSMRGLPEVAGAWRTVETPDEMLQAAQELQSDESRRRSLAEAARSFYRKHLDSRKVIADLTDRFVQVAAQKRRSDT